MSENVQERELSEVIQVRHDKLASLQAQGADPYKITKYDRTDFSQDIIDNFQETEEGKEVTVSIAGRLMSKRVMGKASFAHVRDKKGLIQLYVRRDDIGVDEYMAFKQMDIGDIVGVCGFVFKTQTGEVSIHVKTIQL